MANYNYSISGDTATGAVDPDQLWIELQSLASANPGFSTLTNIQTELDDLKITYIPALSAPQEALLTGAVAAHTPAAPPAPPPTVEDQIAMTDPTAADDDTGGFEPSVRWLNVSSQEEFICTNSAAGAAVWKSTTSGGGGSVNSGNCLFVDAVNGNDGTGVRGVYTSPFLTIAAALAAALSGDLVVVRPGTYDEYDLLLPAGVTLRGMSRATCIIEDSVEHNDPVITMGAGTALEHLTIRGNTLIPFPANGRSLVVFPGTTSADSVARQLVLESSAGNVQGITISGTGVSPQHWCTVSHVDVRGNGVSHGMLSNTTGSWMMRDCISFGLVGLGVAQGSINIQDTQISGNTGLNIAAGSTVYVKQGTRGGGGTPLQNLGTLAQSGDYLREPPLDHADSHLSTGADPIDEFTGASPGVDGLDGLVKKPLAGDESLFLRGDGTWASAGGGVFGNDYQAVGSWPRSTTTSSSFQTKVTLATPVLTGTYRVFWQAVVDQSNTQDSVEARLMNTTTGGQVGTVQRMEPKDTDNKIFVGGRVGVSFAAQAMTFEIQWRQQDGGTAGIQDAVIEIWRTS